MLKKPDLTVNTQRCLELADFVEGLETRHPEGEWSDNVNISYLPDGSIEIKHKVTNGKPNYFSMRTLYKREECGTIACLCGSLAYMLGKNEIFTSFREAADALGINHDQAKALFTPPGWSFSKVTARDAAKVVRHLALTGEVDWGVLGEEKVMRHIAEWGGEVVRHRSGEEGNGREQNSNSI